jgi:hypothetical protein
MDTITIPEPPATRCQLAATPAPGWIFPETIPF